MSNNNEELAKEIKYRARKKPKAGKVIEGPIRYVIEWPIRYMLEFEKGDVAYGRCFVLYLVKVQDGKEISREKLGEPDIMAMIKLKAMTEMEKILFNL